MDIFPQLVFNGSATHVFIPSNDSLFDDPQINAAIQSRGTEKRHLSIK